ncbi:M23 family metallopeptidase [Cohnella cholangitidis]|uniref:M23 family metallopeptidase n=1 Tax=Cohnella cholangitidis TaxID=2598458 RepID=A0A7G5C3M8_9BACL|nr:M23 family metallopeptidase [Cohnella cholangitidis]QMV43812.1 M23 family metallopeptidase [Cohnella cholangitidis]
MQIRNNVRERRRQRIEQIIGRHEAEKTSHAAERSIDEARIKEKENAETAGPTYSNAEISDIHTESDPTYFAPDNPSSVTKNGYANPRPTNEPDPELWWREREKRLKSGQAADWQGLKGIPPTSSARIDPPNSDAISFFMRGFTLRIVLAALALAGIWGWLKLELPGSGEARDWMVTSVTRDMDFEAVEAWYGDTFGGSPSFFPFNRNEPETKEASTLLNPTETAVPVQGRVVQSYTQEGTGIKIAAAGGSEVSAIYTGRVQQVTPDQDGGITVIVQHQNHILSVYGGLEQSSVKPNDWSKRGSKSGN